MRTNEEEEIPHFHIADLSWAIYHDAADVLDTVSFNPCPDDLARGPCQISHAHRSAQGEFTSLSLCPCGYHRHITVFLRPFREAGEIISLPQVYKLN